MHFFNQSIYLGQVINFLEITQRSFLGCEWKLYSQSFLHPRIEQIFTYVVCAVSQARGKNQQPNIPCYPVSNPENALPM